MDMHFVRHSCLAYAICMNTISTSLQLTRSSLRSPSLPPSPVVGRSPAFETLATSSLIVWPPHTWQRQPGGTAGQGTGPGSDATPRHASGALGGPFGLASSLTPTPSLQPTASGGVAAGSGGGRERTSGDGSAGAAATAATAGAGAGPGAAAGLPEDVQDLPLSDYRLQQLGVKVRVVVSLLGASNRGVGLCSGEWGGRKEDLLETCEAWVMVIFVGAAVEGRGGGKCGW